jgi:uncharacterized membrane protein
MTESILKALHLLSAVLWVGGMAFALMVLRPSLGVLEPLDRLTLHGQVFSRFFRIVWHVMPLILLTGYAMLFGFYGGFGGVNAAVHLMHLLGLIMAAVFVYIALVPWPALRTALETDDKATAVASLERIRTLITVNLVVGLLTVAIAPCGP